MAEDPTTGNWSPAAPDENPLAWTQVTLCATTTGRIVLVVRLIAGVIASGRGPVAVRPRSGQ